MLKVSGLYIYPIKSLGGISLLETRVTDRGFLYDRRWMLVDRDHIFFTQRTVPHMCLLQTAIENGKLIIQHKQKPAEIFETSLKPEPGESVRVKVWQDECNAYTVSNDADEWFSTQLGLPCRLVYMPEESRRLVEAGYAKNQEITSFSDAYPMLIIGQASLDDLNNRMESAIPMNRFRPNIVFEGAAPYEEDLMNSFTIGDIRFFGVKPCARCAIPTIDQETAIASKEPTRTLARYRAWNKNVYFGQNLLHEGEGAIHVGDEIIRDDSGYATR